MAETHTTWLWPDRNIGKRESRQLREEYNSVYNQRAELLEALRECVTDPGAVAFQDDHEAAYRRLRAINELARAAIAKATA